MGRAQLTSTCKKPTIIGRELIHVVHASKKVQGKEG